MSQQAALAAANRDYRSYRTDPHGFATDVFGEKFTDDVRAVMESVRDNPVTIARSANAVGKSHAAARIAIWFYKAFPDSHVYTAAAPPERNLRRILWGEIYNLTRKHPEVFSGDRVTAGMQVEDGPQHFITGLTIPMAGTAEQREAKFSGKHAPNMLFIVDEGDAVPNEVYKGIESCMSGGNAHLLIMFNPRGRAGPVYQMEKQRAANIVTLSAFRHPNVLTGQDIIPGAVSQDKTVRRINEWSRPLVQGELPDAECFEVPEFLIGSTARSLSGEIFAPLPGGWRKITNPALSYMVLAEYPSQAETQLINRAWVDAANSRWLAYVAMHGETPPVDRAIIGLDVAEYGRDRNCLCCRYGGFVAKMETWSGLDPDATAIHASDLYEYRHGAKIFVDATGVGAGVAPRMSRFDGRGINAVSIKVAASPTYETELGAFFMLRDQLWWSVREWLRTDTGAMLPPDSELAEELCAPTYAVINGRIRVTQKDTMREMIGRSPDKADSLCLTFADSDFFDTEYGENPVFNYRG